MILFVKTQFGYINAFKFASACFAIYSLAMWLGRKRLLVLGFIALAVLDIALYMTFVQNPAKELDGSVARIYGKVLENTSETEFILKPIDVIIGGKSEKIRTKLVVDISVASLFDEKPYDIEAGNFVVFEAELRAVEAYFYDDEPSRMISYKSNGILLFTTPDEIEIQKLGTDPREEVFSKYRKYLSYRVGGGLPAALLLGDKSDVSYSTKGAFRDSGLMHMLTFSGAHFAILILLMEKLLGIFKVGRRKNAKIMTVVSVLIMLFMGLTPPVARAGLMLIIRYAAVLLCRKNDQLTGLMFAMLIILLPKPYLVENVSLVLTFTSVLGIGLFGDVLTEILIKATGKLGKLKIVKSICTTFGISIAAQTIMTPFLFAVFGRIATYSVLSNVLLFFVLQAMFMLSGMLLLTFELEAVWKILSLAFVFIQKMVEFIMNAIINLPGSTIYNNSFALVMFYLCVLGILGLAVAFRKKGLKPLHTILAVVLLIFAASVSTPSLTNMTHITFLDVGQGDASVVTDRGKTFVFDSGTSSGKTNAGQITLDYLKSKGIKEIESIIISHAHFDHAGGVIVLLDKLDVKSVVLPKVSRDIKIVAEIIEKAESAGTAVIFAEDVDILYENDGFRISIITDHFDMLRDYEGEVSNDKSVIALVERGGSSILFTGDISRLGEAVLKEIEAIPDIDILKVAHHGAALSSTGAFLDVATPSVAVIEVGRDNLYGHPTEEVLKRISYFTEHLYRTDLHGTVELSTNGDGRFWLGVENRVE